MSLSEEFSMRYEAALRREKILLAGVQGGIEHIAEVGAEMLGHPVLLGDAILNILAWTGASELHHLSWEGFIQAGYAPDFQAGRSLFAEKEIVLSTDFYACQVRNPVMQWIDLLIDIPYGQSAAHLVISGEGEPFTDESYELVALLCQCISSELNRCSEEAGWTNSYTSERFLLQLIKGEETNEKVLRFRAELVGLEMDSDYFLLLVDLNRYHPVSHSVSTIRSTLDELLKGCSAVVDNTLVILSRCTLFSAQIQKNISELFKQSQLQGVYSSQLYSLVELNRSYRKTAHLLALRSCREDVPLIPGETLDLFYLIDQYVQKEGHFLVDHPILMTLAEADRSGKTNYLETLYAYLRWGKKPALTCKKLHIHRNTLDYRLHRIEDLTKIDWCDGDLLFRLYLQLTAMYYGRLMK